MVPPLDSAGLDNRAPPGSRACDPGFAEKRSAAWSRALSLPTLPVFPGVDAWKGMVGRPWFIIATPRPRLRNCVFHAPLREGFARFSRSGHGPRVLHRAAGPRGCPMSGERKTGTPAGPRRNHGEGIDRLSARRLRDRGGGTSRRDVERLRLNGTTFRTDGTATPSGAATTDGSRAASRKQYGSTTRATSSRPSTSTLLERNDWMLIIRDWWFADEPFGRAE